jgi:hypothetical protein
VQLQQAHEQVQALQTAQEEAEVSVQMIQTVANKVVVFHLKTKIRIREETICDMFTTVFAHTIEIQHFSLPLILAPLAIGPRV